MHLRRKLLVMVGTSFTTKGGVASVINAYRHAGLFDRWNIRYVPSHVDGRWLAKLTVAMVAFSRFLALLLTGRIELLHVHSASNASFWRKTSFVLPALLFRRPVLFHLHGGGFVVFYHGCNSLQRYVIRFVLTHVASVIVLSNMWQKQVSQIAPSANVCTIPNPVSIAPADSPVPKRPVPYILFMGRLEREKGIFDLIDALAALQMRYPLLELRIAGDGDLGGVRRWATDRGVADAVKFLGWIDGADKVDALRQADALVLPSYVEGMPMSALEAMAAGTPVVATCVGALPELIADGVNGLLVQPGDVPGLTCAIDRLLSSAAVRHRLSKRARDRVTQYYSLERVVPQIEALYVRFGVHPRSGVVNALG